MNIKTVKSLLKQFMFTAIAVAAAFTANAAQTRAEHLRSLLDSNDRNYVFVTMHRGDWRNAPENSTAAILGSIDKGADIVELDVAKTKDGHYVLLHDGALDRVSNGKGKSTKYTLEEIKKFRLKSSDGKTLTDYEILTLDEALNLTRGKILVNLDKFPRDPKGISEFVKAKGMAGEVIMKARYTPEQLKKKLGPDLWKDYVNGVFYYMPIIWINDKKEIEMFKAWQKCELKPKAYELCIKKEKPDYVLKTLEKATAKGGPRIWINTLWDELCAGRTDDRGFKGDTEGSWGWWLKRGATMIQTDRPVELLKYLKSKKRRKAR